MPTKIFISYSHADSAIASKIQQALEEAGFEAWIDKLEVKVGDSFVIKINEAIEKASYLILLLSPDSLSSQWVTREWTAFLANDSTTIVPVIVRECNVPAILRDLLYIDFRYDYESKLKELINFFRKEFKPPAKSRAELRTPLKQKKLQNPLYDLSMRQLRLVAYRCFNKLLLASFCLDVGINFNDLQGESLNEKLVWLLHRVANEGKVKLFSGWLFTENPDCVKHQISLLSIQNGWDIISSSGF